MTYDSTTDTLRHRARVAHYISEFCMEMQRRAMVHDESKLHSPEKEAYDQVSHLLPDLVYGSEEYKASEAKIADAIKHHHDHNSHHPEHYDEGIFGMDLYDIVEMFCDWKASSERNKGGFNISGNARKHRFDNDVLHDIFLNHRSRTCKHIGEKIQKMGGIICAGCSRVLS